MKITEYEEVTDVLPDDNILLDSPTRGTKRISRDNLKSSLGVSSSGG